MTASAAPSDLLSLRIDPNGELQSSNAVLKDLDELRRRMREDGYILMRDLLYVDGLKQVRREIMQLCAEKGWVKPGTDPMDGIHSGVPPQDFPACDVPLYHRMLRLPSFNGMSISKEIIRWFTYFLGGTVLPHMQNIARLTVPGSAQFTTQPHQDYEYIKGTPDTYTAWIPCGDCPRELGGLAILEGSAKLGYQKHAMRALGAGGSGIDTTNMNLRWLATDFKIGDILILHSHTIHAALDNKTADRMRLSFDFRYQRADEPIDPRSMREHWTWDMPVYPG
jgi:hypothetical protein